MERYQNNIQNLKGDAISGVTVTVRRVSDGGIASIFSDNLATPTAKANPFTNDVDGEFFFYAVNARYNIFFTGPITDQKDDVILFDVEGVTTLQAFTDIVTATPPTTEAVTGGMDILDFDGTDILAKFGFVGINELRITNRMHGGRVELRGETNAGVENKIFGGDPDAASEMYHAGVAKIATVVTGVIARGSVATATPPVAEAVDTRFELFDLDGNDLLALVGYVGSNVLRLENRMHGGTVDLRGEDAAGTLRTILSGDPDGQTVLRGDTNLIFQVSAGQSAIIAIGGDRVELYHNNLLKFQTVLETAAGQISGARVVDGQGVFKPVGLGVSDQSTLSATGVTTPFTQARAGRSLLFTGGSASQWDTFASTGSSQTNILNGAMWFGMNDGAGVLTFRGGASVVIRHWNNAGVTPPDADVVIGRGQIFTVKKVSDTLYDIWTN